MTMRLQWQSLVRLLIAFCFVSLFIFNRSDASSSTGSLLGVAPQDESYYKAVLSGGTIKCKDGSKKYTQSQLNDDFCDCLDGSDEPGTSACPNGSFYCKNAGHAPVILYSSRINDGICDCCDGSDEYDGKTKCPNTCWEAGKAAREKLKKKIATYLEGVTIRKSEIELAKSSIAKEEAELQKLKDEEKVLKGLVDQLRERKEQIEKAEEKERLQKEEKERKEAELAKVKETNMDDTGTIGHSENDVHDEISTEAAKEHLESDKEPEFSEHPTEAGLPDDDVDDTKDFIQKSAEDHQESHKEPELSDHPTKVDDDADETKEFIQNSEELGKDSPIDTKVDDDDGNQEKDADGNAESLSREELGRRIASRWTREKTEEQTLDASVSKDDQNSDDTPRGTNDEEYHGFDSEDDEHTYDDDDDREDHVDDFQPEDHYDPSPPHVPDSDDESDLSDITGSSSSSWLDKIQQTVKTIIRAANIFQAPVNISDAAHIRKEFDESSSKLTKIQSRISSLTKKLKQDFGPEKEFYSFYGQCFESKQNKYVYKVCPFKQATQEEGYSTTRLGTWEKFDDSYRVMEFLNGDKCWNGPDRSLKVRLRCGLKNEVADVDEPSRCEYAAILSTPALCLESKLKELQEKLEKLNTEIPKGHDEL